MRRSVFLLVALALVTGPAHAQFGGLIPRGVTSVANDAADTSNPCEPGRRKSTAGRVFGGILGRTASRAASDAGIASYVPSAEFADQLSTAIACRLDPDEQKQAADATLRATRSGDYSGEDDTAVTPEVGSSATWTSETRDGVSGTSTVTARDETGGGEADCITVTDVVIVKGEETTAEKRMCRPPGSRRYSLVA